MTLAELVRIVGLPGEAAEGVLAFAERGFDGAAVARLREGTRAAEAAAYLEEQMKVRGERWGVLAHLLRAAAEAREDYRALGIPEHIYRDTMRCFARFVRETHALTGEWGFDRSWWAWRATALRLFRIGALEYELEKGRVSLHIPSDGSLQKEAVRDSLHGARAFLRTYFPAYGEAPFWCSSWLLHPALRELLNEKSNIVRFRALFDVQRVDNEDLSYRAFVFRRPDGNVFDYPEETALQRRLKQYLLAGGHMGSTLGIWKETE